MPADDTERPNLLRPPDHELQRAFVRAYSLANRVHSLRITIDLFFAVAAVILGIIEKQTPLLGVFAVGWIWIRELQIQPSLDVRSRAAAKIQEEYDVAAGGLEWNAYVAGNLTPLDEIRALVSAAPETLEAYYIDTTRVPEPAATLIRQWQTTAWSRRDQALYARLNLWTAALFACGTLVVGWSLSLSVESFVTLVLVPFAPFILGRVEIGRRHLSGAAERTRIMELAQAELHALDNTGSMQHEAAARLVQDQLLICRRGGTRVPNWFYRILRSRGLASVDAQAERFVSNMRTEPENHSHD